MSGFVLWFTGLSGAGKSTLAEAVTRRLASTTHFQILDGDDVRTLVRRTARFNWHRDLIRALGRQPSLATLLFRTLFR